MSAKIERSRRNFLRIQNSYGNEWNMCLINKHIQTFKIAQHDQPGDSTSSFN